MPERGQQKLLQCYSNSVFPFLELLHSENKKTSWFLFLSPMLTDFKEERDTPSPLVKVNEQFLDYNLLFYTYLKLRNLISCFQNALACFFVGYQR